MKLWQSSIGLLILSGLTGFWFDVILNQSGWEFPLGFGIGFSFLLGYYTSK